MLAGKARVLVADDNVSVRNALFRLISQDSDLIPIGVAASGEDACASAALKRPDIVLMDVQMPGMDGVEATRWIARYVPGTQVLGMSATDGSIAEVAMRAAGAIGFVSKDEGMRHIIEALHATAVERESPSTGIEN